MTSSSRRRRSSGQPSLRDVAAAAGVSHQTVSRVINESPNVANHTRAAVHAAIERLGYRRNNLGRELASLRSGRIGFITSHLYEFAPSSLNVALHEAAERAGYEVILVALQDWRASALLDAFERLLAQSVEAVVLAANSRSAIDAVRHLQQPTPVVIVSGSREQHPLSVGIDNEPGARLATDHLLDLGHQSVAMVSGPPTWLETQQRSAGWRLAHRRRGRTPGPVWPGDWTPASGHKAGLEIGARADVSAVFVANDQMALGVLLALAEVGRRVPDDVSVVGFDNVPEAGYFLPPLTTVHQDFEVVADQAVALAVRAIAGDVDHPPVRIEPSLVIRSSTAHPAEQALSR
jgi:DNA-binding LacI/PurR family transcriptional regulator